MILSYRNIFFQHFCEDECYILYIWLQNLSLSLISKVHFFWVIVICLGSLLRVFKFYYRREESSWENSWWWSYESKSIVSESLSGKTGNFLHFHGIYVDPSCQCGRYSSWAQPYIWVSWQSPHCGLRPQAPQAPKTHTFNVLGGWEFWWTYRLLEPAARIARGASSHGNCNLILSHQNVNNVKFI